MNKKNIKTRSIKGNIIAAILISWVFIVISMFIVYRLYFTQILSMNEYNDISSFIKSVQYAGYKPENGSLTTFAEKFFEHKNFIKLFISQKNSNELIEIYSIKENTIDYIAYKDYIIDLADRNYDIIKSKQYYHITNPKIPNTLLFTMLEIHGKEYYLISVNVHEDINYSTKSFKYFAIIIIFTIIIISIFVLYNIIYINVIKPINRIINIVHYKASGDRILHIPNEAPNKEIFNLMESLNNMYHKDYYANDFNNVIIEQSTNAIICCNEKLEIVSFNTSAVRIFGIDEKFIGTNISQIIIDVSKAIYDIGKRITINGMDILGGEKILSINISQVVKGEREFLYAIFIDDLTMSKKYEDIARDHINKLEMMNIELQHANEEVKNASKTKSEFLANISHEIRTPLNGIIGCSAILMDMTIDAEQKKYAKIVKQSSEDLLEIINDVLDFSKIEAGKLIVQSIPFDIHEVLENVIYLLGPRAQEKKIELTSKLESNVPAKLVGDPTRVRQIILNLVGNSIKFTQQGFVFTKISSEEIDDKQIKLIISVKDTGIGIPKEYQAKMFEKFSQADTSITRKYGGTGLGLSICQKLAEIMGGTIGVESEEGQGALFTVTLMMLKFDDAKHGSDIIIKNDKLNDIVKKEIKGHILIVEDNEVNLLVVSKILEKINGIKIDSAANGEIAVQKVKDNHYDLVFMDCQMPVMDGFTACKTIRNDLGKKDLKIVAITAKATINDRDECLGAGMDDFVSKPFKKNDIIDIVYKYLA